MKPARVHRSGLLRLVGWFVGSLYRDLCQAGQRDLERDASIARVRSERRCGELLKEMTMAKGGWNAKNQSCGSSEQPQDEAKTLSEMGTKKALRTSAWCALTTELLATLDNQRVLCSMLKGGAMLPVHYHKSIASIPHFRALKLHHITFAL